ncbi:MAG: TIR domain-containing protein [Pseudomonadota bacterium]
MADTPSARYWAFISYSHRNEKQAAWLHRSLEGYRGHAKLVGQPNLRGEPVPARLFPVFRDRDELAGAPDLSAHLQQALRESRFLVVLCSPEAARSPWVNEEIRAFKALGGEDRVLALIVDGEPHASGRPETAAQECFPPALRHRIGPDGQLSDQRTEPIAADLRKGRDGPQDALLKLLAGLLGVRFDDLKRRDQERAARRRNWITAAASAAAAVFGVIAVYALQQQRIAEDRSQLALSRQLAAQAANDIPDALATGRRTDLARGLLLAVHALRIQPSSEARAVLLKAVLASPQRLKFLWGHGAALTAVAFSADSRLLASADEAGQVLLWDVATQKPLGSLPAPHQGRVSALAFHPQQALLATAGADGQLRLWNPATRQPVGGPLPGPDQPLRSLAFSPDGRLLAAGGGGTVVMTGQLLLWALDQPQAPRRPAVAPHGRPIESLAFSPDGSTLASGGADGRLVLWDVASLQPRQQWEGHPVASLAFSADGQTLASGGDSRIGTRSIVRQPFGLILWDVASGTPRPLGRPPEVDKLRSVAFGADGLLASSAAEGKVLLWDPGAGQQAAAPFVGHVDTVTAIAFSRDGRHLASASADGGLLLRSLQEPGPLATLFRDAPGLAQEPSNPFMVTRGLALSADGRLLAAEQPGGRVLLWDAQAGVARQVLPAAAGRPSSIAMAPDGRSVVLRSARGITLWDVASGAPRGSLPGDHGEVDARAFSPGGRLLAIARGGQGIVLWDLQAGAPAGPDLAGPAAPVVDLAFSADGQALAAAGRDGQLQLWDPVQRQLRGTLALGEKAMVRQLRFSPDGRHLALLDAAGRPRRLILVQVDGLQQRRLTLGQDSDIDSLRFSPDSRLLVAAGRAGALRLWDLAAGQDAGSALVGHAKDIEAIGFFGDPQTLVSVDSAGLAMVWDVQRRTLVARGPAADAGGVRAVAFADQAPVMLLDPVARRNFVRIGWSPQDWVAAACTAANRDLSAAEWAQFFGPGLPYQPACPPPAAPASAR